MNYYTVILNTFKRPIKAIRIFYGFFYYTYIAHHRINLSYFRSLYHCFLLYYEDGFFPEEALQYGFLSDKFGYGSQHKYTSRKKMSAIQRKINPYQWEFLTEDKSFFYSFCDKFFIPTPRLFGIFFKDVPGWNTIGKIISGKNAWIDFLANDLPHEFVIKPSMGVYGRGIKIFQKDNGNFYDEKNLQFTSEEIYNFMSTDDTYNSYVIQERLHNHEQLSSLSGTESLQTIRIITYCFQNIAPRVLHAYLKPIVGKNIVDNQNYGRTGNLLAEIDTDTGILKNAIIMDSKPYGIKQIDRHPDTKVKFSEFIIPHWNSIYDLAMSTAPQFLPIRSIGWDIAQTPNGPYIIEGNIWWDPPKQGNMDRILKELNNN